MLDFFKKELQSAALAGRKANVREFDLSNLLIVVLVVGLGMMLWGKM